MKFVEQIKNNLLEIGLVSCLVKAIAFEPTFGLSLAVISLVVSITYKHSLNKKKLEDYDLLLARIESQEQSFVSRLNSKEEEFAGRLQSIETKIDGINIDRQIKQANINDQAPQTIKKSVRSF